MRAETPRTPSAARPTSTRTTPSSSCPADHNEIEKLARAFERERKSAEPVEKGKLALRICHALEVDAAMKHDVFYPAAEAVLEREDKELLGKARPTAFAA